MKHKANFAGLFRQQLTAKSPRRILLAVALLVGGFWLVKTTYTEWRIMRVVSVIAGQLRQLQSGQFSHERHESDINSNRA